MAVCTHTSSCALFPMISVSSANKIWRTFYCEGKWQECARYHLSLEGKQVPPNMLPNGKLLDIPGWDVATAEPEAEETVSQEVAASSKEDDIDRITSIKDKPPAAKAEPEETQEVIEQTHSHYLRMQIKPATGVMSEIIRTLGEAQVRIDAVTEKKGGSEGAPSYLIVLTDQATREIIDNAVNALQNLDSVIDGVKVIALEAMRKGQFL